MKYLLLPGNSPKNKQWIDDLFNQFNLPKHKLHYNHWDTNGESINFYTELSKLQDLDPKEEYIAVCKSAGCFLALLANRNNILNIEKFFFIGFPFGWAKMQNLDIEDLFDKVEKKEIVFIQKENDPAMHYEHLKEYLMEKNLNYKLIKYERKGEAIDNHDYEDVEYLKEVVDTNT